MPRHECCTNPCRRRYLSLRWRLRSFRILCFLTGGGRQRSATGERAADATAGRGRALHALFLRRLRFTLSARMGCCTAGSSTGNSGRSSGCGAGRRVGGRHASGCQPRCGAHAARPASADCSSTRRGAEATAAASDSERLPSVPAAARSPRASIRCSSDLKAPGVRGQGRADTGPQQYVAFAGLP